MTLPAPTFGQIRARVQAVRRKVPDARAVGIRTPGRYGGERLRTDGAETYRIEQCDSSLAALSGVWDQVYRDYLNHRPLVPLATQLPCSLPSDEKAA